jgi:hypothetical protein
MGRAAPPAAGASDEVDDSGSASRFPARAYVPIPRSREEQRERARDPRTPVAELRRLARSHHWDVRVIVAGRPEVPASTLEHLAKGGPWAVQAAIARRPDLTPRLQQHLGGAMSMVRLVFATNPTIHSSMVARLLGDRDGYVAGVAAGNPGAPPKALEQLAAGMQRPAWILRNIATNPACPPEVADELLTWLAIGGAGDQDPYFDPVTCSGSPSLAGVAPFQWYVNQACGMTHPEDSTLWRIRAAIVNAQSRLPHSRIRDLAVDEVPDVRLAAASYRYHQTLRRLEHDDDPRVRAQAKATKQALRARPFGQRVGAQLDRANARGNLARVLVSCFVFLLLLGLAYMRNQDSPRSDPSSPLDDLERTIDPNLFTTSSTLADGANAFTRSPNGQLTFAGPVSTATMPDRSTILTGSTSQLGAEPGKPLLLQIQNAGRGELTVTQIASLRDGRPDWDMTFDEVTVPPGEIRDILYAGNRQPTSFRLIVRTADGSSVQTAFVPEAAPPTTEGPSS